jgi:hypothetical protein
MFHAVRSSTPDRIRGALRASEGGISTRSTPMPIAKHALAWILGVPAALLTLIYVLSHL